MASRSAVTNSVVVGLCLLCVGHVLRLPTRLLSDDTKRALGYPPDSLLNFTERCARYGYPAEEHRLHTQDGYILTLFRMAGAKGGSIFRAPPVILMHGLLQSADITLDFPKAQEHSSSCVPKDRSIVIKWGFSSP
ncbi:Lipase member K [Papilio xuthus]|uniref:Lipase member K n=1 Tax=Papilio xuthus TaxID=66420 RepID=A0A194QBR5_PAPXU|nr:Lipase member K [Papilio xuthus]